jgi:hypothetical protein
MWEMASGISPQHPQAHDHLPSNLKRQSPPSVQRTTGFATEVTYSPASPMARPNILCIHWKPFRDLVRPLQTRTPPPATNSQTPHPGPQFLDAALNSAPEPLLKIPKLHVHLNLC